jgi:hypothetical protein
VGLDDSLGEKDKGTRHLEVVEYHYDHTKSQGKTKPYYTNSAVAVEVRLACSAQSYTYYYQGMLRGRPQSASIMASAISLR